MQNLEHNLRVDNLVTPQDIATAGTVNTNTAMYRSMKLYRKGLVVITAHLTDTKTCVAQLTCSSAAAVAGKANVTGKTVTLTGTTAAPEQVGVIEFDVNDLVAIAAAKFFAGVDLTTNENGDDVSAVLVRGAARYYQGASMPA